MKHTVILWSKLSAVLCNVGVYGLKIIGLAPFSYGNRSSCCHNAMTRRIKPFKHSTVGSIYGLLLLIPISVGPVKILLKAHRSELKESNILNDIDQAIWVFHRSLTTSSACVILTVWSLKQKKVAATLNLLCEVGARLSKFEQRATDGHVITRFVMHPAITVATLIMVGILLIQYGSLLEFVESILKYLAGIINLCFGMEYSMLVGLVAWKLRTINHSLMNYHELGYSSCPSIQNNAFVITYHDADLAFIRLLRSVRATLLDLRNEIANFFSLPILFCICHYSSVFVIGVFHIFMNAHQSPNEFYSFLQSSVAVNWAVILFGGFIHPVLLLTFTVTRIQGEARLTSRIVNKLLFAARKKSQVQLELEQFSYELLHDKVDVFTAYGLFRLDSTLLPSILASTATYFIVLLQFRAPIPDFQLFCNCTNSQ